MTTRTFDTKALLAALLAEDQLPLPAIPPKMQARIVSKTNFATFVNFELTSRYTRALCARMTALPFREAVSTITIVENKIEVYLDNPIKSFLDGPINAIRWETVHRSTCCIQADCILFGDDMDNTKCADIRQKLALRQVQCHKVCFSGRVTASAFELNRLLIKLRPAWVAFTKDVSDSFSSTASLKMAAYISLEGCDMSDNQLLQLTARHICFNGSAVTDKGINLFLREWRNGQREFTFLTFNFSDPRRRHPDIKAIIEGLDANLIWSEASHGEGMLRRLGLPDVQNAQSLIAAYSFWKPEEFNNFRTIQVYRDRIVINNREETKVLQSLVDLDKWFFALYGFEEDRQIILLPDYYDYIQPYPYRHFATAVDRFVVYLRNRSG